MKPEIRITKPESLRALAHPTRLALVSLLREHGTLTATRAAELLGLNSGSCSFHLRQLAKHGLVEEVPARGRQKPWRATARITSFPEPSGGPEMAAALHLFSTVLADRYAELMHQWLDRRETESPEWQKAAWFGDLWVHMTAEELSALETKIEELVAPYQERVFDPATRPPASRLLTLLHVAIPREPIKLS
jgi:predicted ArsR family transcriptional regulator